MGPDRGAEPLGAAYWRTLNAAALLARLWHGGGQGREDIPTVCILHPKKSQGALGAGRREGKAKSADLGGRGWLCVAPGSIERMDLSGTIYGGYTSSDSSLFDFRLLESRNALQINPQHRGFFDVAGTWHGPELVMDRPGEQGVPFQSGLLIDQATVTLHWASYEEFEASCRH